MKNTIFMIHGMSGGEWCWEKFKEFFTKKCYRCITPTLKYHDVESHKPPDSNLGTTSLLDYVEDLEKIVLNLKSIPIIMGHSMGALLAQKLATRVPTKALVLLSSAPPYGIFSLNPYMIKAFRSIIKWNFWGRPVKQNYEEAVYSALHLLPKGEKKRVYKKSVSESGKVIFEIGLWFLDFKKASKVDETKITSPILIITGSKDRLIPPDLAKKINEKYKPLSEYKEFSQHAHWILGEPNWMKVVKYIDNWLKRKVE